MRVDITTNGNSLLVSFDGRLDSSSAPEAEREINSRLDGINELTLDLTELLYVSSAGLRIFLALKKKMNSVQGSMVLLNPNELVSDVFEATGFDDILDIRRDA